MCEVYVGPGAWLGAGSEGVEVVGVMTVSRTMVVVVVVVVVGRKSATSTW